MSDNVFSKHPLSSSTLEYCVNDVVHLPKLHNFYHVCLAETAEWFDKVADENAHRVREAQSAEDEPNGPWKALAQWPWW